MSIDALRASSTALATLFAAGLLLPSPGRAQVSATDLIELLPQRAGEWGTLGQEFENDPPSVASVYLRSLEQFGVGVQLGYGPDFRAVLEEMLAEARAGGTAIEETERGGYPVYFFRSGPDDLATLVTFVGDIGARFRIACGREQPCPEDEDEARRALLTIHDALDADRLARFPADATAGPDAPAGFRGYAGEWPEGEIEIVYPEDWRVVDLYRTTIGFRVIGVVRDEEAAEALYGGGFSVSTEDTLRLVTPDNVHVTFMLANDEGGFGTFARQLDQLADRVQLVDPRVVQPPTETTVGDHPARELRVHGEDADGHDVAYRHLVVDAEPLVLWATVLRPREASDDVRAAIDRVLASFSVTPAEPEPEVAAHEPEPAAELPVADAADADPAAEDAFWDKFLFDYEELYGRTLTLSDVRVGSVPAPRVLRVHVTDERGYIEFLLHVPSGVPLPAEGDTILVSGEVHAATDSVVNAWLDADHISVREASDVRFADKFLEAERVARWPGGQAAPAADAPPDAAAGGLPEGVSEAMIVSGEFVFTGGGNCVTCHGPDGTGTALAPDLTDDEWLNSDGSYESIVETVRNGVAQPQRHPTPMPPMGGAQLTDEEVRAVAAYVYSLSRGGR